MGCVVCKTGLEKRKKTFTDLDPERSNKDYKRISLTKVLYYSAGTKTYKVNIFSEDIDASEKGSIIQSATRFEPKQLSGSKQGA
ncbi:hypothetical protein SteCoe_17470 [Stentor coeruleus]|uniref:Uncharacterized protein n=1 Tax=Stentor coeruleus TaxID=5963 RepID=A0A1R2BYV5_9CILI|nr:hypothetical protein SteCoe_17470 [Stentor coeruleus]